MQVFVGTSGYSYKEWKGSFYPEDIKPPDMLGYYSRQLRSVEINNTFYRMPKREVLEGWAAKVPDGFRFAIKASRRITHMKRLKDCGEELDFLLGNLEVMKGKLGPVLFQLPPYLKKDLDRLQRFLELLPKGLRAAFEFRSATWYDDEVFEALRSAGSALVIADTGDDKDAPLEATADFGYLRLRRPDYPKRSLTAWAKKIARQPWSDAWVFFKHEDEGAGPRMAKRFEDLLEEKR